MPKKSDPNPRKPDVPDSDPISYHVHTWRVSFGPDGTPSNICECGQVKLNKE